MWWKFQKLLKLRPLQIQPCKNQIVLITGCDSGLGYSAALEAVRAGFTVIAGLLQGPESSPARKLRSNAAQLQQLHVLHLDVTKDETVSNTATYIKKLIQDNSDYRLHAVVNNAGIMTFGEFEWQTPQIINDQHSVNFLGTIRVTKAVLPLLRQSTKYGDGQILPRIVNVGSHCGYEALPLLSIYSSTKFALRGWMNAMRLELEPHKIHVVNFIPGRMVDTTNIVSKQAVHTDEMRRSFDKEQLDYYSDHFEQTMGILSHISKSKPCDAVDDRELMEKLMATLRDERPDNEYMHQPWLYAFYYPLLRICPKRFKYNLMYSFLKMPKFKSRM